MWSGSPGDLDSGEENTADNMSLSGEEGGASDLEDSAEGDSSSPPSFTPVYSEGNTQALVQGLGKPFGNQLKDQSIDHFPFSVFGSNVESGNSGF